MLLTVHLALPILVYSYSKLHSDQKHKLMTTTKKTTRSTDLLNDKHAHEQ